eukprot:TRINITY_DN18249_c0_g1_i1.p1 TRINITY_DN18249_c0_g1~~TRINITY_DN18249_c0_g1_i1.p1  ORF type:complete len:735 (-),score=102.17 TRINITY_DN18249_c0_g1_i1:11-2215(-)
MPWPRGAALEATLASFSSACTVPSSDRALTHGQARHGISAMASSANSTELALGPPTDSSSSFVSPTAFTWIKKVFGPKDTPEAGATGGIPRGISADVTSAGPPASTAASGVSADTSALSGGKKLKPLDGAKENLVSAATDTTEDEEQREEEELEKVLAQAKAAKQDTAAKSLVRSRLEEAKTVGEGQLIESARHARDVARLARHWTDHAAALVDATRIEGLDAEACRATTDAATIAREVPAAVLAANRALGKLGKQRSMLQFLEDREQGRLVGLPVGSATNSDGGELKRTLRETAATARQGVGILDDASRKIDRYEEVAAAAERQSKLVPPVIRDSDVHMVPATEAEGLPPYSLATQLQQGADDAEFGKSEVTPDEPSSFWSRALQAMKITDQGEPSGKTSSGCFCDDQVKCSRQGKSFNWCRVGGGEPCVLLRHDNVDLLDPGGADHFLYHQRRRWGHSKAKLERTGAVWDYCTPKPVQQPQASAAHPTAHGGICSWRGDLLHRYGEDPQFRDVRSPLNMFGKPPINASAVPARDRLAIEAMIHYQQDPLNRSLCTVTSSSNGFSVCPVMPDPAHPEWSDRGWLATHGWDYCTDRAFRPSSQPGVAVKVMKGDFAGNMQDLGSVPGPRALPLPPREVPVVGEEPESANDAIDEVAASEDPCPLLLVQPALLVVSISSPGKECRRHSKQRLPFSTHSPYQSRLARRPSSTLTSFLSCVRQTCGSQTSPPRNGEA